MNKKIPLECPSCGSQLHVKQLHCEKHPGQNTNAELTNIKNDTPH